jgi:chlorobactene glucosyltransferase
MHGLALLYHIVTVAILVLVWINTLLNLVLVRRIKPVAIDRGVAPLVSILVPARNEASRIVRCLTSLVGQEYPDFEVILLDDQSDDETWRLAEGIDSAGRLRLLRGEPLPEGWTGKNWACHQLARAAHGSYLLFTDADTMHAPEMLRATVSVAQQTRASLLTLWPRQITNSLGEKSVVTLIYLAGAGFLPHVVLAMAQRFSWIAARLGRRVLGRRVLGKIGAANGQFLLFERDAYLAIGGHSAVRNHLVEDVALGRKMAARIPDGFRLIHADGQFLVTCRMYESLTQVWEGFTKNCRAAFDGSVASFLFVGLLQFAIFFGPFALACFPGPFRRQALEEVAAIYGLRFFYAARYRSSFVGALLHPIGELLGLAIGLNSWRKSAGTGVQWKGRTYQVGDGAAK